MGRETILFKSEEKRSRSEIGDILRQLADKVDQGSLNLRSTDECVDLEFPENITIELKVEEETKRRTKRSLEIELEWFVGGDNQGSMVIG